MLALRLAIFDHLVDLRPRRGAALDRATQRHPLDRRRHDAGRHRGIRRGGRRLTAAGSGDALHRPLPDPQPGHHRRLAGPCRSGRRVPGGGAGPRRRARGAVTRRAAHHPRRRGSSQGTWTTALADDEVLRRRRVPGVGGPLRLRRRGAGPAPRRLRPRRSRGGRPARRRRRGRPLRDRPARPRLHARASHDRRDRGGRRDGARRRRPPRSVRTPWPPAGRRSRQTCTPRPSTGPAAATLVERAWNRAVEEALGCLRPRSSCSQRPARRARVEPRLTLADFIRERCHLTGTHLGCEHGVCGACTVLLDGDAVRACLVFAVQADGAEVTTIEGMTGPDGELSPVPGRVPRPPRAAVRVLHPGLRGVRHRVPPGPPEPDRPGDPGGALRQPVPLHRVPGHPASHPGRRRRRTRAQAADDLDGEVGAGGRLGRRPCRPACGPASASPRGDLGLMMSCSTRRAPRPTRRSRGRCRRRPRSGAPPPSRAGPSSPSAPSTISAFSSRPASWRIRASIWPWWSLATW